MFFIEFLCYILTYFPENFTNKSYQFLITGKQAKFEVKMPGFELGCKAFPSSLCVLGEGCYVLCVYVVTLKFSELQCLWE